MIRDISEYVCDGCGKTTTWGEDAPKWMIVQIRSTALGHRDRNSDHHACSKACQASLLATIINSKLDGAENCSNGCVMPAATTDELQPTKSSVQPGPGRNCKCLHCLERPEGRRVDDTDSDLLTIGHIVDVLSGGMPAKTEPLWFQVRVAIARLHQPSIKQIAIFLGYDVSGMSKRQWQTKYSTLKKAADFLVETKDVRRVPNVSSARYTPGEKRFRGEAAAGWSKVYPRKRSRSV